MVFLLCDKLIFNDDRAVGSLLADKTSHYDVYHKKRRVARTREMQLFVQANRMAYEDCLTQLDELTCLRFLFNSDFFWAK